MPRCNVSFNRVATKEYRESHDWYAKRSTEAATNFISAIDATVSRIIDEHDALPVISGKFRRVRVKKYPYILVFYPRTDQDTRVVAVAHTSRRPGYWRRRE